MALAVMRHVVRGAWHVARGAWRVARVVITLEPTTTQRVPLGPIQTPFIGGGALVILANETTCNGSPTWLSICSRQPTSSAKKRNMPLAATP